ncbi:MAG TPA: methyltransferase domain-containing protein [Candidatus Limnocylindria bacterium]|nr:methyltransferase domain-containing protein [Candidatus Limnocylindria bacterium]
MTTSADALAERLFTAATATFDLAGVYLGDRLGYYRSLAGDGPATAEELAARTGTDTRYTREWLEQQAVAGILDVDGEHRFSLSAAHALVLVEEESLNLMAPLSRMITAAMGRLPSLVEVYRTGHGMGWDAYGADMREGQASFNRPAFTHLLPNEWLPAIDDLHARLHAQPAARVADIGCGEGWSTIAMARAYPSAEFVGIDLDAPSIDAARRHAAAAGMNGRLQFRTADAARLGERFDAAIIIEAVHDMANPVPVLAAVRDSLTDDGSLIVVDERVAEEFTAPGDDLERFMYGWSITTCLPDGLSRQPSVGTGTVMRPATLRAYAAEAGFGSVEILPIENDFFRFYRLRP